MKKTFFTFSASLLSVIVFAQQKEFEGIMTYKIEIQSKNELISNRALMNMMALGNVMTIRIKHGNYRQISGVSDTYFITRDQRSYIKFKDVDTLYYLDYADDTTSVTRVSKSEEKRNIAGVDCKLLTVQLGTTTRKYYYSPTLYMDPKYDKNNKIGRYDVFANETSSLYLSVSDENKSYTISQTCIKMQPTAINDSVFELPKLPQKKFSYEELVTPPEFTRSGGWPKYLQTNLNGQLAAKYLKIPKGDETASQQVMVRFMINEYGRVASAEVVNKKEVNSRLAEEALRVVNESPAWKPAKFFGESIIFWMQAPITFQVTK